ncbi:hypothetical protein FACS189472_16020 [Alphaproteobacteria bacterium]|nr:hypothetical protein FACS189472_16020 [Alphaproteobacteria bacterium]
MATRVLLFALCLLTACSGQKEENKVVPERKSESIPSEQPKTISNDSLIVKAELSKDPQSIMLQQKIEASNNLLSADAGTKNNLKDDVKEVKASTVTAPDGYQIPIRTYTPIKSSNKDFIVMYVRDRGRAKDGIEEHDSQCRELVNTLGTAVVYADCRGEYKKDHPLAIALNDDVACVYSWLTKSYPNMKIVLTEGNVAKELKTTLTKDTAKDTHGNAATP